MSKVVIIERTYLAKFLQELLITPFVFPINQPPKGISGKNKLFTDGLNPFDRNQFLGCFLYDYFFYDFLIIVIEAVKNLMITNDNFDETFTV